MVKKILVTGSGGLVGSRFLELYPNSSELLTPEIEILDITQKIQVEKFFQKEKPEVVVHLAAFTDVSVAENERDNKNGLCWKINIKGVENLVSMIDPFKTHLIHISTDYVFPGSKENPGPYPENTIAEKDSSKVTWYGFTKAEGERIVRNKLDDKATILRLIYPVRAKYDKKLDYLRKPLSLFDEGKLYPMFTDQQVSITYIDEACEIIKRIIKKKAYGTFHSSTPDTASPYELISYLIEKARGVKNIVKPSSLDDFLASSGNSPVRYPKFGGLKVEKTAKILGFKFSPWKKVIDTLISQGLK
jgi:dTDP-4-dehydrorhamnose reductase